MSKRQELIDRYVGGQESLIFLEPKDMDEALVGVVQDSNGLFAACYSEPKIIKLLMEQDKISFEEAVDFFNYKILDACFGPGSPVFLDEGVC